MVSNFKLITKSQDLVGTLGYILVEDFIFFARSRYPKHPQSRNPQHYGKCKFNIKLIFVVRILESVVPTDLP